MVRSSLRSLRVEPSTLAAFRPLSPNASLSKQWQFRRDLLVFLAYRQGFPKRFIGDAFEMCDSAVRKAIQRISSLEAAEIPYRPLRDSESTVGEDATRGKRRRFRRDQVILMAHRQGLSHQFIADVFDLRRTRVSQIIQQIADSET